ncbi:MAG: hypothetical protein M3Y18_09240 [Candidatus Eremiobacteraeota bacterium]|nr:hypothetical protein [Candidatus Eremiobacteraeota bacterium]
MCDLLRIEPIGDRKRNVLGIDHFARLRKIVDRCGVDVDVFGNERRKCGFEIT